MKIWIFIMQCAAQSLLQKGQALTREHKYTHIFYTILADFSIALRKKTHKQGKKSRARIRFGCFCADFAALYAAQLPRKTIRTAQ